MPLEALISAAGFLGAIIILRANQWVKYREESKCATAATVGLIWAFSTAIIGIIAIIWASCDHYFGLDASTGIENSVASVPFFLLIAMGCMVIVDILNPTFSLVYKALKGMKTSQSFLENCDEKDKEGIIGTRGKIIIAIEIFMVISIFTLTIIFALLHQCC